VTSDCEPATYEWWVKLLAALCHVVEQYANSSISIPGVGPLTTFTELLLAI
jgi:hypothetical protein